MRIVLHAIQSLQQLDRSGCRILWRRVSWNTPGGTTHSYREATFLLLLACASAGLSVTQHRCISVCTASCKVAMCCRSCSAVTNLRLYREAGCFSQGPAAAQCLQGVPRPAPQQPSVPWCVRCIRMLHEIAKQACNHTDECHRIQIQHRPDTISLDSTIHLLACRPLLSDAEMPCSCLSGCRVHRCGRGG